MGRTGRSISTLLSISRKSNDLRDDRYDKLAGLSFGGRTFDLDWSSCKISITCKI